jgi:glycosyltransferase involved in cell wall biosynthesis
MRDMARAYPEFHHVNVYFYDNKEDYEMMNEFQLEGIDVSHVTKLTEELVRDIDPVLIVLHNTPGELVEGEWPYDWLKQWPIISLHHNKSFPAFHVALDVFVSDSVLKYYDNVKPRMNWKLIPPCIDLSSYAALKRGVGLHGDRCVIGKLTSNHPTRYPPKLLDILGEVQNQVPEVEFSLIGAADHWKDIKLNNCKTPATGSMLPQSFYNDFDIFVHKNVDECVDSWGRTVSEAMASGLPVVVENRGGPKEQVDHKVTGYLCDTDEQFIEYLAMLAKDPQLRYDIGMKAREKAMRDFGIDRFRRETQEVVLKAALGVI